LGDGEEGEFPKDLLLAVMKADCLDRTRAIFATQSDMADSPLGSLTTASPHLNPFEARTWFEWLAAHNKSL